MARRPKRRIRRRASIHRYGSARLPEQVADDMDEFRRGVAPSRAKEPRPFIVNVKFLEIGWRSASASQDANSALWQAAYWLRIELPLKLEIMYRVDEDEYWIVEWEIRPLAEPRGRKPKKPKARKKNRRVKKPRKRGHR